MKCPSGSLFMALVLKSILSDMSIAMLGFLSCLFTWNHFLQPFTFSLCRSFVLRLISCRQTIFGSCFLIHSTTLLLLIGAFNPFTFKVIIDRYLFIPPFCSCVPLSFTPYLSLLIIVSFTHLVGWFGGDVFFQLSVSGKLLISPSILIDNLAW